MPDESQKANNEGKTTSTLRSQENESYKKTSLFSGVYRYTPQCDSGVTYVADDVATEKCEFSEDAACIHCGYGDNLFKVFRMKDGNWVFCSRWSGCLSYSSTDGSDNFVFVSTSEQDMIDHAMDSRQRSLYTSENGSVNHVQTLWWEG